MQVIYILKFKINIKKNRKERKTKEQLILFASGLGDLGWVTSLGPEQAGSPGGTVLGLRALGGICQPMSPSRRWTWASCSPLHESTISRSRGPPAAELNLFPPKDGGVSGLEELCKVPWAPCLLVAGFPPPASFLRVTPLRGQLPLPRGVAIIGIAWGMKGKGEEVRRHTP